MSGPSLGEARGRSVGGPANTGIERFALLLVPGGSPEIRVGEFTLRNGETETFFSYTSYSEV